MNIFLTVGSQIPFDRLTRAVDTWAGEHNEISVFAQIGKSSYQPQHMEWATMITPDDVNARIAACDCVVGHAGMGTILSALQARKPVLIMPRFHELGEVRNDHQRATVELLGERDNIHIARDETELIAILDDCGGHLPFVGAALGTDAQPSLLAAIDSFITTGRIPASLCPDTLPEETWPKERIV